MGGRFINAFVAGLCVPFVLLGAAAHNPMLFFGEAFLVALNLGIYFHGQREN